ncbi:hemerythrin domain-containing protein [Peredibacter sp. HCB2-198]|uniref:hemerythrin domain-containing protein n=1 Tax=Peredibacter sp. HCB2-198 TaxID=3383025 RepID=UPI0038B4D23A
MKNESVGIQDINVIDLILIDHRYIKECIEVMIDENADKRRKMSLAKSFLDAVHIHSQTEKRAIYAPLESNEELHFNILEAQIEHGIIDQKIRSIKAKMARVRVLRDEHEAELKVLAEILKKHLIEEETEILPKMKEAIDDATLNELGVNYMKLRKFSPRDLQDYPQLQDELIEWKDSIQKVSSEFLTKMDKFVENLQH